MRYPQPSSEQRTTTIVSTTNNMYLQPFYLPADHLIQHHPSYSGPYPHIVLPPFTPCYSPTTAPGGLPSPLLPPLPSPHHHQVTRPTPVTPAIHTPAVPAPPAAHTPPVPANPPPAFQFPSPPSTPPPTGSPLLAFARTLLSRQSFHEFQQLVTCNTFPRDCQAELRDLWWESVYNNHMVKTSSTKLSSMQKYRLRKRHPLPRTIWDGEATSYNLRVSSREYLLTYYEKNPFPTADERRTIARETGSSYKSVSHWFKNRRNRSKKSSADTTSSTDTTSTSSPPAHTSPVVTSPVEASYLPAYHIQSYPAAAYNHAALPSISALEQLADSVLFGQ
eukprot:sb/3466588/